MFTLHSARFPLRLIGVLAITSVTLVTSLAAFAQSARPHDPSPQEVAQCEDPAWLPLTVSFLGRNLDIAGRARTGNVFLAEYVAKPETLENWTVRFAIRYSAGDYYMPSLSVAATAESIRARKHFGDPVANYCVLEDIADGSWFIDFTVSDSAQRVVEHQVFRYFTVEGGLVQLQYARRAFLKEADARAHLWRVEELATANPQEVANELLKSIHTNRYEFFAALSEVDVGVQPLPKVFATEPWFRRTPQMAVAWARGEDPRKLQIESIDGDAEHVVAHLCFPGPTGKAEDKLTVETVFTGDPLRDFVDRWAKQQRGGDGATELFGSQNADGTFTVALRSSPSKEMSIHRFLQARDGIYRFAYTCPEAQQSDSYAVWSKIIESVKLKPNPERWKWRESSGEQPRP